MRYKISFALLLILLAASSCKEKSPLPYRSTAPTLPSEPFSYTTVSSPDENDATKAEVRMRQLGVTDEGATLGRVLFYDRRLSENNSLSCGSCHQQSKGFSDGNRVSEGFDGGKTSRNSSSLANPVFNRGFFWDTRASTIEEAVLQPIGDHVEMGLDETEELLIKLEATDFYPELFDAAFGDDEITEERIADALGQFIFSLNSFQSPWDTALAVANNFDFSQAPLGDPWEELTPQEFLGLEVYRTKATCVTCHDGPSLSTQWGNPTANIGVLTSDPGLGALDEGRMGEFKIPSLRNIALTAPYMHDGRFATLRDVIDHYSDNIQPHPNLDSRLFTWGASSSDPRFHFTDEEKEALEAFLHTMTDENFLSDPRFSDPFDR